jgi:hypothetical protein
MTLRRAETVAAALRADGMSPCPSAKKSGRI